MTADRVTAWFARPQRSTEEVEQMWDNRAPSFYAGQIRDTGYFPTEIAKRLKARGVIGPDKTVLEIGAGTGRYVFPIARESRSVLATDLSAGMLSYIEKHGQSEGFNNITCKKLNWNEVDLEGRNWNGRFDFVHAVMCPATHSKESLRKMSAASRGYCCIGQFIRFDGKTPGSALGKSDPHNDREAVLAHFSTLWDWAYNPEIEYLTDTNESGEKSVLAFILWNTKDLRE